VHLGFESPAAACDIANFRTDSKSFRSNASKASYGLYLGAPYTQR